MHDERGSRVGADGVVSAARGDSPRATTDQRNRAPGPPMATGTGAPRRLHVRQSSGTSLASEDRHRVLAAPCCDRAVPSRALPRLRCDRARRRGVGHRPVRRAPHPDWTARAGRREAGVVHHRGGSGRGRVRSCVDGVTVVPAPPARSPRPCTDRRRGAPRWSWQTACSTAARRHWISSQQTRQEPTVGRTPSPPHRRQARGQPDRDRRREPHRRTCSGPSGSRGSSRSTRFTTRAGVSSPVWTSLAPSPGSLLGDRRPHQVPHRPSEARLSSEFAPRGARREAMICALTGWVCIRITWADLSTPSGWRAGSAQRSDVSSYHCRHDAHWSGCSCHLSGVATPDICRNTRISGYSLQAPTTPGGSRTAWRGRSSYARRRWRRSGCGRGGLRGRRGWRRGP